VRPRYRSSGVSLSGSSGCRRERVGATTGLARDGALPASTAIPAMTMRLGVRPALLSRRPGTLGMRIDQYRLPLGRYRGERRAYLPGRPAAMSRHSTSRASAAAPRRSTCSTSSPVRSMNACRASAPENPALTSPIGNAIVFWRGGRPQQSTWMDAARHRRRRELINGFCGALARRRRRRRPCAIRSCVAAPRGPNGRLP
jgi:hypothetical protein